MFFWHPENPHTVPTFSSLVLISWLSSIAYFRIYKQLRVFIDMLSACIVDMRWFMIVLFWVQLAVTNAFYFDLLRDNDSAEIDGKAVGYLEYVKQMYTMIIFADFSHSPDSFSTSQWIFFFFSTVFVFIIMLNLLIAIIGDTYSRVTSN